MKKPAALLFALAVAPALAQQALPIGPGPAGGGSGLPAGGLNTQVLIGPGTWGSVNLATMATGALPVSINAQSGTTYTIASGDAGKIVTDTNAAATAVTVPQATGSFAAGFSYTNCNMGAGAVTATPTTSTINGAANVVLQKWDCVVPTSDGVNWQAVYIPGSLFNVTAGQMLIGGGAGNAPIGAGGITVDGVGNNTLHVTNSGLFQGSSGGNVVGLGGWNSVIIKSNGALNFTTGDPVAGPGDAAISRTAAGTIAVGTGSAGNASGILQSAMYQSTGTKPSLALAGGTCAGTVIAGGATAGTVTLTGSCASTNTMTLSAMPATATGYSCYASNRNTPANLVMQTSTTTTTSVFTFSGTASGATDVIQYHCVGY